MLDCPVTPVVASSAYNANQRHVFTPSPRRATDLLAEDWRDLRWLLWHFRAGGW